MRTDFNHLCQFSVEKWLITWSAVQSFSIVLCTQYISEYNALHKAVICDHPYCFSQHCKSSCFNIRGNEIHYILLKQCYLQNIWLPMIWILSNIHGIVLVHEEIELWSGADTQISKRFQSHSGALSVLEVLCVAIVASWIWLRLWWSLLT